MGFTPHPILKVLVKLFQKFAVSKGRAPRTSFVHEAKRSCCRSPQRAKSPTLQIAQEGLAPTKITADQRSAAPLENIVVLGVYAVAHTQYSLFSPLSCSLHPPPAALPLQARRGFPFAMFALTVSLPQRGRGTT